MLAKQLADEFSPPLLHAHLGEPDPIVKDHDSTSGLIVPGL